MAEANFGLVYGGGDIGLMGVIARAVHQHAGYVYGVIPASLEAREGIAYEVADELVITTSMAERKERMFERADAFLIMAGGIGTLDEWFEVLTLKQLGYHQKPIIVLNTGGIFDGIFSAMQHLEDQGFVSPKYANHATMADSVDEAIATLETALGNIKTN